MSKLTDLLNQARKTKPQLGEALAEELRDLANRRTFGLVFEQHQPENVELPGVHPQRGDKVHILPPRGEATPTDPTLWQVLKTKHSASPKTVVLEEFRPADDTDRASTEPREVPLDDVVVVAETGDTIYPGLIQTGEVLNGPADAPAHVVINAENSHALRMLTYTHAHSVDVIYIDPPYNTGAKDWKYNNDYVGTEDDYRHSKWLSFMQRRLGMAKQLLNPDDSVLVVTIDEKEYLRLGLLLEQSFPEAKIQMISSVISAKGSARTGEFSRCNEYIFVVMLGSAAPNHTGDQMIGHPLDGAHRSSEVSDSQEESEGEEVEWGRLKRNGKNGRRAKASARFYPIFLNEDSGTYHSTGATIANDVDWHDVPSPSGTISVWPVQANGSEQSWSILPEKVDNYVNNGYIKFGKLYPDKPGQKAMVYHLTEGYIESAKSGNIENIGTASDPRWIHQGRKTSRPFTVWHKASHEAGWHGTRLLSRFLPGVDFDYAKSLYAVEDTLRFFVTQKPDATVLDFFSGSGTTAHAVMRLNKQDGGRRRSISITNNEVSADEQKALREKGLRPGDTEWEAMGICDYVTKPRVTAAITGKTPAGEPVKGRYTFTDEFDMADGFDANARFFTLTYESAAMISQRLAFERVAPLLWLRAGQTGRVIDDLGDTGWDIADTYAVIENTGDLEAFLEALTAAIGESEVLRTVFVITDDDRQFQATTRRLDDLGVDSHRLYASYLTNFEFTNGDAQ